MCEKTPFWVWFIQELVEPIRAILGFIRGPGFEQTIGFVGTAGFLILALSELPFVLLSLLSFLVMMHGNYRAEGDC